MVKVSLRDFLIETSLYAKYHYDPDEASHVNWWFKLASKFDAYCVECGKQTTWADSRQHFASLNMDTDLQVRTLTYKCSRIADHSLRFEVRLYPNDHYIMKFGQYPSHADISLPELKRFGKMLGEERARELNKAVGLAAHGAGIGAFAYLRRVFESILQDHRASHEDGGQPIENYNDLRVGERITAMSKSLPAAVVENTQFYGLLSKGLHELSDEQCLEMFPILKDGLILILEQDMENRAKAKRETDLRKQIAEFGSRHS